MNSPIAPGLSSASTAPLPAFTPIDDAASLSNSDGEEEDRAHDLIREQGETWLHVRYRYRQDDDQEFDREGNGYDDDDEEEEEEMGRYQNQDQRRMDILPQQQQPIGSVPEPLPSNTASAPGGICL